MFKLDDEDDVVNAFRPKDRKALDLTGVTLPMFVRNYLSWQHPSGSYVYLVFSAPGGVPTGIVFETNGGPNAPVAQMCDWCHQSGVGTQVGLLTAKVTGRRRVGVHVCSDLSCQAKLEDEANRSGRSVLPQWEKLIARIGRFATEALKIDLSGAGR